MSDTHRIGRNGETIVAAAIMDLDDESVWTMPPPARHHDVMLHMHQSGVDMSRWARLEQGFVTSLGDFVRRKPACWIARKAGQIEEKKRTDPQDTLFSEDLW